MAGRRFRRRPAGLCAAPSDWPTVARGLALDGGGRRG